MTTTNRSNNQHLFIFIIVFLLSNIFYAQAELTTITRFSNIAQQVQENQYYLSVVMVSRFDQCPRCDTGNKVLEKFAKLTDGVVLTYIVDCEKVWENIEERHAIPGCDPKNMIELPHITFFSPVANELDRQRDQKQQMPKDLPYKGMVSEDALLSRAKELLPSYEKMINNMRELDLFLNDKEVTLKFILFTDEQQAPLYIMSLSGRFKDQVEFAIADIENRKLKKRFNVTEMNTLFALKLQGTDYERVDYTGSLKVPFVARFLHAQLEDVHTYFPLVGKHQGIYFKVPESVEVSDVKAKQIPDILKRYKENFILIHLKKGQNSPLTKVQESIATDFNHAFKYFSVLCEANECEQLYGTNLKQYPSVLVYNISQQRKITEFILVEKYQDKNNFSEIILSKFTQNAATTNEVTTDADAKKMVQESLANKKHVVLFSHQRTDSYHKLLFNFFSQQVRFRRYLRLLRFVDPKKSDQKTWDISQVPGAVTILSLNAANNNIKSISYSQSEFNFQNIVEYLNERAIQREEDLLEQTKIQQIDNQDDLEDKCLNQKTRSCIICLFDFQRETKLNSDLEKFEKVRKQYTNRDYSYFKVDAKCHRELLSKFKLSVNSLNSLVFIDPQEYKYKLLKGPFEIENIHTFMSELDRKNKGLIPIPGQIDLIDRDCHSLNEGDDQQDKPQKKQNRQRDDL